MLRSTPLNSPIEEQGKTSDIQIALSPKQTHKLTLEDLKQRLHLVDGSIQTKITCEKKIKWTNRGRSNLDWTRQTCETAKKPDINKPERKSPREFRSSNSAG
uniref:Uncharacterized protein n=1 Tax=Romanomermis culicivorax TaxID=13658 RepID=A0A915HZE6_ROMCU